MLKNMDWIGLDWIGS